ncbi:PAS domain S-box protein [Daejeonella sp. JGW-45]|uniref:PAS domain S-box protein n=1 Tax=Daejeonella sp. JGW-45 TaxID=3034148 RepID=UPI0023EE1701|nr:PAS domain S-box protein [Daejeonella sp. JGW-45]
MSETLAGEIENARLLALKSYRIVDSLPEAEYDRITRLAAYIFKKPVALISFVDRDNVFIKSQYGIQVEHTLREESICKLIVEESSLIIIEDTTRDTRTASLSNVLGGAKIRFYAGTPLISPDGKVLGSLSVMDFVPGTLNEEEKQALEDLAFEVVAHLEVRKKNLELKDLITKHEEISTMFNNSAELQCITDRNGIILVVNKAVENLLGYTPQEGEGRPIWDFFPEEDKMSLLPVFSQGLSAGKKNFEVEVRIRSKDGTLKWMGWSLAVKNNKWYANGRDITERKAAEEQLLLVSLVASKTINGVAISNSEGKIKWVNDALENLTGYTLEDFKNTRPGDLLAGEGTDKVLLEAARRQASECKPSNIELLSYKKDGSPIWLSISNTPTFNKDGSLDQQVEIINDISERKLAEAELIKTREEALQLSKAKETFLSVMSHEIRTPLNAVIGMSHILMDDNPTESQKENLKILGFSAQNLLKLINDILDFTKIETGHMVLESANVNLKELVSQTLNSLQFKTADRPVALRSEIDHRIPTFVKGDNIRLYQILMNLLGNAVKFTEEGEVKLKLDLLQETKQSVKVRFEVSDTGIGIEPEKIDYIFDSYTQANSDTTRKYGGTGLGLAITKSLVSLHNSDMVVESEIGKGSKFSFIIDFALSEGSSAAVENKTMEQLSASILIVDDNEINRILASKVLSKWGVKVDFAENGKVAVDKVQQSVFDLVLMDLHMPVMNGMEATRTIRSLGREYSKLPIVALTASLFAHELETINECGMDGYVMKPFIPGELYAKIKSLLTNR